MSTFVYAPGVRIYIDTEKHGIIDVSEDLVDYTLQRRSDGPSVLNFSVQNVRRKYDHIFAPNDRVVVEMKRITWMRVFTGLLNSVPLVTAWPRVVAFSASCSLKRLQYWYWDPNQAASYNTVIQAIANGEKTSDAGITNAILTLLRDVVGWPESKAHIGAVPENWFGFIEPYVRSLADILVDADAQVAQVLGTIQPGSVGGTTTGGVSTTPGSGGSTDFRPTGIFNSKAGGSWGFSAAQLMNAEIIVRVGKSLAGASDRDIAVALLTAMQESSLDADLVDGPSTGLFQQKSGWGGLSPALRTNPVETTKVFYAALLKISNRNSIEVGELSNRVQMYADEQATKDWLYPEYRKFEPFANELVKVYNSVNTSAATAPAAGGGASGTGAGTVPVPPSPVRSAKSFVESALNLVEQNPGITYGGDISEEILRGVETPKSLGCSPFMTWVLYKYLGRIPSGWPIGSAQEQGAWCLAHGGKKVPLDKAYQTYGTLLINDIAAPAGHVAITVGNGKSTIESSSRLNGPAYNEEGRWSAYDYAVTLPMLDYTSANNGGPPPVYADGPNATNQGAGATGALTIPYTQAPGYNEDNEFDSIFGKTIFPMPNAGEILDKKMALAFSGPRALMNDQPLLPFIKNLVNSSLRSFCSAPNGDFMAWFPDYYGLWGSAAKMVIEPIELQDFYVEWTDDYFVTHQYTVSGTVNFIDGFSGEVTTTFGGLNADGTPANTNPFGDDRLFTAGIASIDIPGIMYALFGIKMSDSQNRKFANWIYKRFGARPDFKEMDGLVGRTTEVFSALYYFMRQWAYQYNANVPLTFMPELWPGMIIQIPEYDFQAYVTAVTHTGQMGEGGGHSTQVNIAAPARLSGSKSDNVLIGLPVASGVLHPVEVDRAREQGPAPTPPKPSDRAGQ